MFIAAVTNWLRRGETREQSDIARQAAIIDILQRRPAVVDVRANGRSITITFMRDGRTFTCEFYNAGVDVGTLRDLLGLK